MKVLVFVTLVFFCLSGNDFIDDNKYYYDEKYFPKGYIFDDLQIDIMYGSEKSFLDISSKIEHIGGEGEPTTTLTDGGEFIFNSIQSKYKKIHLQLLNKLSLSYTVQGTDIELDTSPWEAPKLDVPENGKDVFFLAKQFIGGYGEIKNTNTLLGHESEYSLIYREAEFEGLYRRGDVTNYLTMNKNQYGLKIIVDSSLMESIIISGNKIFDSSNNNFTYWKFLYEGSTFPQVVYIEDFYNPFNELDENFKSNKYTIALGIDSVKPNGFIYGYELGLGASFLSPSDHMLNLLAASGYSNIDTTVAHLHAGINLGYQYRGIFDYTALSFDLLYNFQLLYESSEEPDEDADPNTVYLTYQRTEMVHNIKYALTWSF